MGKRRRSRAWETSPQGLTLTRGAEVVDVVERVPDGWYELACPGSDLHIDVRRGHAGATMISINGHRLRTGNEMEDDPEVSALFEQYPYQFAALLLIAREAPELGPGRYRLTPEGITPVRHAFNAADHASW